MQNNPYSESKYSIFDYDLGKSVRTEKQSMELKKKQVNNFEDCIKKTGKKKSCLR